jgi:hypothetical protein
MKKTIIAGLIIGIMLPATSLAYGGFGFTPTVGPRHQTAFEYRAEIQKKIHMIQIQILHLKIELLKLQLKNRNHR